MKVICGYLEKNEELKSVTSGGFLTALAKNIVKKEGIVFGVTYSNDFKKAQYIKVDNFHDIELIKGTKYIRADKKLLSGGYLHTEVENCLKSGKIVLCIGLPCEISSVYNYLHKRNVDTTKYYAVDLVCHGPAINEMHSSFIELLELKYSSSITNYNVRFKNPDWRPAFIKAEFENGQVYLEKLNNSEFGKAFNICPQQCSYTCNFKKDNRKSDITVGDYWGVTEFDNEYNSKGVSVGFVHTERSKFLLNNLEDFILFDADESKALKFNPRYSTPLKKNPDADRFLELYKAKGLAYACNHYMSPKTKIKKIVKNIIKI